MDVKQAYATLGVSPAASRVELRDAYRTALFRYHPDTGSGNVRALEAVTAAYHQLAQLRPDPVGTAFAVDPTPRCHLDIYA